MADKMQKQKRPEIFFIRNDGGQYWDGRTWVDHEHKAEVFCGSSAVHTALVLMCSDEDRSAANVVPCVINAGKACDQIRIQHHDDTYDMVHYSVLDRLIPARQIKRFLRYSEGWVSLGSQPVRGSSASGSYTGRERRSNVSAGRSKP